MNKEITVLSLFDGMSAGRIALERTGVKVNNYFASEIDKHAIKVSKENWNDITHIGDVTKVSYKDGVLYTEHGQYATNIDLLIGGSPCQGFSMAGKQIAFDDPRSRLYFEYERILSELKAFNPNVKFLLENVKMKQEFKDVITSRLGVEPIAINSNTVSAQNRYRLYWANIQVEPIENTNTTLVDILEPEVDEKYFVKDSRLKWLQSFGEVGSHNGKLTFDPQASHCVAEYITGKPWGGDGEVLRSSNIRQGNRVHLVDGKSPTLSSQGGNLAGGSVLIVQWPHGSNKGGLRATDGKTPALATSSWPANNLLLNEGLVRKLTPVECERLQTVPDGYTSCVSDTQRYKMLGNGWTVDVIVHILSHLK